MLKGMNITEIERKIKHWTSVLTMNLDSDTYWKFINEQKM